MEHQDGKVGKYTIVSKIGDGGMAEVFMGRVRGEGEFEKIVAIKKILPNLASNERFRRNFINEARICAKLHHHNIVEVYDFIQEGSDLYLVMEYIDGLTLEDVFAYHRDVEQQLTTDIIFAILLQILEGLDYAHNATDPLTKEPLNVIHRDLKPSNILIDERGMVKIVDFGVAKAQIKRYETQEFTAKGSPSYMAPEQILGNADVTQAADVFSVGSVFYELLTLERLFDGANVFAILKQVTNLDIDKHLENTIEGADRRFLRVLKKSLAREVDQRYQTAGEMLRDLTSMFHGVFDRRRLADHLRKIRNLDESVEDAATRLVTDVNALLAEYGEQPEIEHGTTEAEDPSAEDPDATTPGSRVPDDTEPIEDDTQTVRSALPPREPVRTLTQPLSEEDLAALLEPRNGDLEADHGLDVSRRDEAAEDGEEDEPDGVERARVLGAPPEEAARTGEAPDDDPTLPATPGTSRPVTRPVGRAGVAMPSIFGGEAPWVPAQPTPFVQDDGVDLSDMEDPPPSLPVRVGSLHESQPSTLAPILFGACIGLVILVFLALMFK